MTEVTITITANEDLYEADEEFERDVTAELINLLTFKFALSGIVVEIGTTKAEAL